MPERLVEGKRSSSAALGPRRGICTLVEGFGLRISLRAITSAKPVQLVLALAIAVLLALTPAFGSLGQAQAASSVSSTLSYNSSKLWKGKQTESGACLCYAYSYASAVTSGLTYAPAKFRKGGSGWSAKSMEGKDSGEFVYKTYKSKSSTLKATYDAVLSGHPVILHLNTKSGGSHWVCVVGVKNANRSNLSLNNFLALDSTYVASKAAPVPVVLGEKGYSLRYDSNNVRIANSKAKASNAVTPSPVPATQKAPTISAVTEPSVVSYGAGFMPKGTISSSSKITQVQGLISADDQSTLQVATVSPNVTKAKVESSYSGKKIAGSLKFSKLKPGNYSYTLRAVTNGGKKYTVRKTSFKVYAPLTSITKFDQVSKTSVRVNWKKVSGASGYQVRYSTKATMEGSKTKTFAHKSWKRAKVSGLKAGTTYYVQVRSYKKSNGSRCYGSWSSTSKVTTKASTKKAKTANASKTSTVSTKKTSQK